MAKAVRYLHEKHFVLHSDLHSHNWFIRRSGDIVCGDMGCSKVLGQGGTVKPGTSQFYYEGHSSPEAQIDENHKTIEEFSFANDTWQLAFCFTVMLNEGQWFQEANKSLGEDVYDLIKWMQTEEAAERPLMPAVIERLERM